MRPLGVIVVLLTASACKCGPDVAKVNPSLAVSPAGLDFGQVKVADSKQLVVRLEAQTRTSVVFSSSVIEGAGAAAYRLGTTPASIDALGNASVTVTFTPPAVAAFTATLVLNSNDPDRPATRIALAGEGAMPKLVLTPDCQAARGCTAAVVVEPPAIDFGMEPLVRLMPIDPTRLPTLVVVNEGAVALQVTGATFGGPDAAAFTVAGGMPFPAAGVTLEAAAGFNLPIRFVPTSEAQMTYAGTLTITSDDPDRPSITVQLTGTLRPNQPPFVCANLIRVVPQLIGDSPRDYASSTFWAPLHTPPVGGYDFTATRDVRPDELAVFSANSDATDPTKCSADPEDGRTGLTYRWRLTSTPRGAQGLALSGATTAQVQVRPVITGEYTLELTVTDSRMSSTVVTMRFAVAIKQDLVAQLQWEGFSGVDLDLHLVRPSAVTGGDAFTGAFAFFNAGTSGKTAGDLNGFAKRTKDNNAVAGFDFDWGQAGASDDPSLNLDDRGDGQLIENASLNDPEHDPLCATASCSYRVMVHVFADNRMHVTPPACLVDGGVGCLDGEACSCATGDRCVAESAPANSTPGGSGKCYPAPKPVLRLFFKGSPTPATIVPLEGLMPPDEVLLGAPCKLWHVADVAWPAVTAIGSLPDGGTPPPVVTVVGADGTGRVTTPSIARFGVRAAGGSLRCEPDSTQGALQWYSRQP